MNRFKRRLNMQAIAGQSMAIMLILATLLAVVGVSVAMPFIGEQELKAGDYFVYVISMSDGVSDVSESTVTLTVLEVGDGTMSVSYQLVGDIDIEVTFDVDYAHNGRHLQFGSPIHMFFPDLSDVPDTVEKTYSASLIGFAPIVIERYEIDETFIMVKMGTNVILEMEGESESSFLNIRLEDTNVKWLKVF